MNNLQPVLQTHYRLSGAYSRVILLSPADAITGGPEALHQLAHAIREAGGEAGMAYYAKDKPVRFAGHALHPQVTTGPALEAYARYAPQAYADIELTASDLLVFPEVMASYATMDLPCQKAVWWLSVDNALSANPSLRYPRLPNSLFEDRDLLHFYQSAYARAFLSERGAKKLVPLSDYTNIDGVIRWIHDPQERSVDVALFPNKGAELAQSFIDTAPELSYTLIRNMTRPEVGDALRQTRVYIDFGNQPGKDRVPREAAVSGNVVFLHHKGAGSYYEDSPLDDVYLFTEEDIRSGNLKARVQLVLDNRLHNFERQAYYRQRVFNEKDEFAIQVRNAFACVQ